MSGSPPRGDDLQRFLEPERVAFLRNSPAIIAAVLAGLTLIGVVLLRPTGQDRPDLSSVGIVSHVYDATVADVDLAPCLGNAELTCARVEFTLKEGPDKGTGVELSFVQADTSPTFSVGERVVLDYNGEAEPGFEYSYADRQRRPVLLGLAVLFAAVVLVLGRWKGLAALAGLFASVLVLLLFVIPSILDGRPPLAVAIVGASLIAYLALYAAHGFTRMTTIALLGTLAALGFTALLGMAAVELAAFTGLTADEAFVITVAGRFDLAGLLLAGVVLGALGAIDDITVTQASTVWELHRVRPDLSRSQLVASGLRVGRDHVASTVNTLLLAYAGAAMPLMLFFVLADQSLGTVLNGELVAVEVVRTLVGSIGLVLAVPFTTWLAAVFASESFAEPRGE